MIPSIAFSSLGPTTDGADVIDPTAAGVAVTDEEASAEADPEDWGNVRAITFCRASVSWGEPGARIGEGGRDRARLTR